MFDPADNHSLVMAAKDMLVQNPGMAPVFTHYGGFIFCNNDDAEAARCFLSQVGDYMGLELSEESIALVFNQAILELDRPIEL